MKGKSRRGSSSDPSDSMYILRFDRIKIRVVDTFINCVLFDLSLDLTIDTMHPQKRAGALIQSQSTD